MSDFAECSIHTPAFTLQGLEILARVVDVYDGDTLTVVMRAPTDMFHKFHVRISGIDTPEIKDGTEKALQAKMKLVQMITGRDDIGIIRQRKEMVKLLGEQVYLVQMECGLFDKYGRLLANVMTTDGVDIGQAMLQCDLAYAYDGGAKSV